MMIHLPHTVLNNVDPKERNPVVADTDSNIRNNSIMTTATTLTNSTINLTATTTQVVSNGNESQQHAEQLLPNDIVCGRGGYALHHLGNQKYLKIIAEHQEEYLKITATKQKTELSRKIVQLIRSRGGRFVKKDPQTKLWIDVGDYQARKKVSQALREGAPEIREKNNKAAAKQEKQKQAPASSINNNSRVSPDTACTLPVPTIEAKVEDVLLPAGENEGTTKRVLQTTTEYNKDNNVVTDNDFDPIEIEGRLENGGIIPASRDMQIDYNVLDALGVLNSAAVPDENHDFQTNYQNHFPSEVPALLSPDSLQRHTSEDISIGMGSLSLASTSIDPNSNSQRHLVVAKQPEHHHSTGATPNNIAPPPGEITEDIYLGMGSFSVANASSTMDHMSYSESGFNPSSSTSRYIDGDPSCASMSLVSTGEMVKLILHTNDESVSDNKKDDTTAANQQEESHGGAGMQAGDYQMMIDDISSIGEGMPLDLLHTDLESVASVLSFDGASFMNMLLDDDDLTMASLSERGGSDSITMPLGLGKNSGHRAANGPLPHRGNRSSSGVNVNETIYTKQHKEGGEMLYKRAVEKTVRRLRKKQSPASIAFDNFVRDRLGGMQAHEAELKRRSANAETTDNNNIENIKTTVGLLETMLKAKETRVQTVELLSKMFNNLKKEGGVGRKKLEIEDTIPENEDIDEEEEG